MIKPFNFLFRSRHSQDSAGHTVLPHSHVLQQLILTTFRILLWVKSFQAIEILLGEKRERENEVEREGTVA